MHYAVTALLALLLAGCTTVPLTGNAAADLASLHAEQTKQVADFLTKLSTFTIADLQAASADAKAHNDPEFAMCWDGLQPIVLALHAQGGSIPGLALPKGAASTVQAIRDILQGSGGTGTPLILKQINMVCGPAYVAGRADVLKVLIAVGAASAGAPGAGQLLGSGAAAILPLLQQGLP